MEVRRAWSGDRTWRREKRGGEKERSGGKDGEDEREEAVWEKIGRRRRESKVRLGGRGVAKGRLRGARSGGGEKRDLEERTAEDGKSERAAEAEERV